jgi:hypothetical protein
MDLRGFHNRLRIMIGIDRHELEAAGVIAQGDHNAWGTFHRDPYRWLIRCDDETAKKLWAVIERRAGTPPVASAPKRMVPPPPPPTTISKGGF